MQSQNILDFYVALMCRYPHQWAAIVAAVQGATLDENQELKTRKQEASKHADKLQHENGVLCGLFKEAGVTIPPGVDVSNLPSAAKIRLAVGQEQEQVIEQFKITLTNAKTENEKLSRDNAALKAQKQ